MDQYDKLYEIRRQYGGTFATVFQDETIIPWKPLSLEEYMKYSEDRDKGFIPVSYLENEIFIKCVLDKSYIRQLDFLKAGIVHTVVSNVWQYSGPTGASEFASDLELTRAHFLGGKDHILHELVNIISMAFPYKPEEIYAMTYETFLFRLIQAEQKLLKLGIYLQSPITIELPGVEPPVQRKLGKIDQIDAKKIWDEINQPEKEVKQIDKKKWWNVSPVLEAPNKHGIDFKTESKEQLLFGATGHEQLDAHLNRSKLVQDAHVIYKDLIEELAKKKKGR